jgi:hypothetical protein
LHPRNDPAAGIAVEHVVDEKQVNHRRRL